MGTREDSPSNEQQLKDAVQLGIGAAEIYGGIHTANPALAQDGWNRVKKAAGQHRPAGEPRSSSSSG
jgi:hypothetical protein